jgi:tetratricopeptide (TPR) repeat protein
MERADLPNQGFIEEGHGDPDYAHALFRKVARKLTGRPLPPSECSRFWTAYTLEYIRTHPLSAFTLEIKKLIYFWRNYEVHDIDSAYKNYRAIQTWPLLPFGVLAVLGLLGISLSLSKFRWLLLLYSVIVVYLLSVLIFFAASRYRLPAVPFLAIFSAYAITSLSRQLREKQFKKFLLCSAIVLGLWATTNHLFQMEVNAFARWQRATRIHYSLGGNFYFQRGLYRRAVREYEKAIALQPDFAPAHNRLGMCYALVGQLEKAENHFQTVITISPDMDQGHLNLGLLYLLKGEPSRALPLLEKALFLNPENEKAREQIQKIRIRSGEETVKVPKNLPESKFLP